MFPLRVSLEAGRLMIGRKLIPPPASLSPLRYIINSFPYHLMSMWLVVVNAGIVFSGRPTV